MEAIVGHIFAIAGVFGLGYVTGSWRSLSRLRKDARR